MNISLNGESFEFHSQPVAELIAAPMPPCAVCRGGETSSFVPKTQYCGHLLQAGNQVDIVRPVRWAGARPMKTEESTMMGSCFVRRGAI